MSLIAPHGASKFSCSVRVLAGLIQFSKRKPLLSLLNYCHPEPGPPTRAAFARIGVVNPAASFADVGEGSAFAFGVIRSEPGSPPRAGVARDGVVARLISATDEYH